MLLELFLLNIAHIIKEIALLADTLMEISKNYPAESKSIIAEKLCITASYYEQESIKL